MYAPPGKSAVFCLFFVAISGCGDHGNSDGGDDLDMARPPACTPTAPRPTMARAFIEPEDGTQPVVDAINAAQKTLDLTMYELSTDEVVQALVAAAGRGVTERIILDRGHIEAGVMNELTAAGIAVQPSSSGFVYTHEKAMLVDGVHVLVFSGNYIDYSFFMERNFGITEDDPDDAATLAALFEADWNGMPSSLSCTRLIVSPDNSRARLIELINSATTTLELEALYLTDLDLIVAVKQAAMRGVAVRALLNDPAWGFSDASTGLDFKNAQIPVRRSGTKLFIHAKLVMVDGKYAFVGSENFSQNSLDNNREVGVVVAASETTDYQRIVDTFEMDWAASPSF
jgi:cardiolipin synthase